MERDFLGLGINHHQLNPPAAGPGPSRSSTMDWAFPNKASSVPHFLSFQEDNGKTSFGSRTPTGLVAITTTDFFASDHNKCSYGLKTTYPTAKKFVPGGAHCAFLNASMPNLSLGSQPHANVPFANPLTTVHVVRNNDLRNDLSPCMNGSKISGATPQLTIFYNGSVCVYDNISSDKAQAIMLLAGNVPSTPSSAASNKPSLVPKSPVFEQPHSRPTPIMAASFNIAQPTFSNDMYATNPSGVLISSSVIAEPLRAAKSAGSSSSVKFLPSDTVPQFRKKSLARFLEKRKERVIGASPYGDKEHLDCNTVSSSGGAFFLCQK